jgi:flagellar assembly factor FliW
MLIQSPRFGPIEVSEERIVTFPEGLLGFRDFKGYYFHEPAPGAALKWMQCVEVPALGFVVTDPRLFKPDYTVSVAPAQLEGLEMEDPGDSEVWVILTIPEDPRRMTANLQGPLVINAKRRLGAQVVIIEEGVTTKYPVLEGAGAAGNAARN